MDKTVKVKQGLLITSARIRQSGQYLSIIWNGFVDGFDYEKAEKKIRKKYLS